MTFLSLENIFKAHTHEVIETFPFALKSQLKILSTILLVLDNMAKEFEITPSDSTSNLRVAQITSIGRPAGFGNDIVVCIEAPIGKTLCPKGDRTEVEKLDRFFSAMEKHRYFHAQSVLDRERAVMTDAGECFIPVASGNRPIRAISHHTLLEEIPMQFDRPI